MDHDYDTANQPPTPMSLLRDLTPRQRLGLAAAALIVLIGLGWKLAAPASGPLVPLPGSETLDPQARREVEERLRAAGLGEFRSSEGGLLVPRAKVEQCRAVLSATTSEGETWAGEWERQNQQLTPFSGHRAREAGREIARAKLITEMLQKLPDVQQADVVWDVDAQRGWGQPPRARATVYLMPRAGRVLTLEVIRSVRLAVAGSKKNLDPADVAVMDLARQITYDGDLPVAVGEDLLPALQSVAELCRREIVQQIECLSERDVDVRVDLPRFFAFLSEHPHQARQQLSASAPGLLRVDVNVPAASGLSADDATRDRLHARILSLTGIGGALAADDSQVDVRFEQQQQPPLPRPAQTAPALLRGGWSLPDRTRRGIFAGGAAVLMGFIVLRSTRTRAGRRRRGPGVPPAFHDLGGGGSASNIDRLSDFDELAQLDAATLRDLYPHATPRRWAVALRGSSRAVCEHLAAALAEEDAHELREHCEQLGPVTLADIDASRRRILESARFTPEAQHYPSPNS